MGVTEYCVIQSVVSPTASNSCFVTATITVPQGLERYYVVALKDAARNVSDGELIVYTLS